MRILLATMLALTAVAVMPADIAPAAEAAPCLPEVGCIPCVISVHYDPKCIVYNPCDPRYCDPIDP